MERCFNLNVFITGASGGLGRALAVECAKRGYNLFLTDVDEDGLSSIKRGLERRFNVTTATCACDLTSPQSVDEMLAVLDKHRLRFDMLLNIAGLDFEGSFIKREREEVVKIATVNNAATLRITHAILSRRKHGSRFFIVFVSSLASMFPIPLKAAYAASKRFILDFSTSLNQELKPLNASLLTLCPGGLATTPDVVKSIEAQGLWGGLTTNPLELVASRTLDKALKGSCIYIPGLLNRVLSIIGKAIPRQWVAALLYKRWSNAQKQWLNLLETIL